MIILLSDSLVRIDYRGGVVIKNRIVADGHYSVDTRFISHAHTDHLIDIESSIKTMKRFVAHKASFELMEALDIYVPRHLRASLDYGDKISVNDDFLRIRRAKHILGSSLLEYVSSDGRVIVYTGDFKEPGRGTEIIQEPDILVTEATYGDPSYVRSFKDFAEDVLIDLVMRLLSRGPIFLYAYYGKQQEIMDILRRGGVIAPFIAPEKVYRLSKIAENHGLKIGDLFHENSREASEIMREGWFIYFTHPTQSSRARIIQKTTSNNDLKPHNLYLTGWLFETIYKSIDERTYVFSFSDHADFQELIDYIEMSRPRLVIVDSFRSGETGKKFAKEIKKRLGIEAIAMP